MAHEDQSRGEQFEGSSDRGFGFVFAAVFLVVALWPLFFGGTVRWWAVGVAALFALVAVLKPTLLARPNKAWMQLGLLLGRIVSPIALGILFFVVISPIGALMKLTGKDPLRLKFEPSGTSYWIPRDPPGPKADSLNQQF